MQCRGIGSLSCHFLTAIGGLPPNVAGTAGPAKLKNSNAGVTVGRCDAEQKDADEDYVNL
jgi:hypothetical protein